MGNVMTFPLLMLTGMTTLNNYVFKTSNDEAIWNTSTEAIFIYSEDSATVNTRAFYIILTVIYVFSQTSPFTSMIQSNG